MTTFLLLAESLECDDHAFDELEDFADISTIALPDDNNFVITSDGVMEADDDDKTELDQSCDDSKSRKDDDEVALE